MEEKLVILHSWKKNLYYQVIGRKTCNTRCL